MMTCTGYHLIQRFSWHIRIEYLIQLAIADSQQVRTGRVPDHAGDGPPLDELLAGVAKEPADHLLRRRVLEFLHRSLRSTSVRLGRLLSTPTPTKSAGPKETTQP